MKRSTTAVFAGVVLAGLAACGAPDESAEAPEPTGVADEVDALGSQEVVDELDRLYQAAQDAGEDRVTIYGAGENDRGPVYEVFMQRYPGIEVSGEHLTGPDFDSKISNEFASGQHVGDLVQGGDTSVAGHIGEGLYVPYTPVTAEGLDPRWTEPTNTVHAAAALPFGIGYNTNAVEAGEAPQTWAELGDEAWRGRIVMDDPTVSGSSLSAFRALLADDRFGEQYLTTMAAQEPHNENGSQNTGAAVASGEFDIAGYYPYSFFIRESAKGAPMGFVFPTEGGSYVSGHYLGLIDGAPNPNAAKLLMNWLFTPEGQQALAAVGYYPTMPESDGPADFPPMRDLDLIRSTPLETVASETQQALATIQEVWPK
ncbi:ABC transporter substrate-binding protein [Jiangella muralis]|uniref:ABC transporter substrate-binding protein n=1 Tax=Jiangella muralis TaxID=702383 RepID=UPI0009F9866F|nr:extracellular solute-binding protein [Jiangella muralis]